MGKPSKKCVQPPLPPFLSTQTRTGSLLLQRCWRRRRLRAAACKEPVAVPSAEHSERDTTVSPFLCGPPSTPPDGPPPTPLIQRHRLPRPLNFPLLSLFARCSPDSTSPSHTHTHTPTQPLRIPLTIASTFSHSVSPLLSTLCSAPHTLRTRSARSSGCAHLTRFARPGSSATTAPSA